MVIDFETSGLPVDHIGELYFWGPARKDVIRIEGMRLARLRRQFSEPPLANGYRFVCAVPPACRNDGFIFFQAYTEGFARREVLYAPPYTKTIWFGHDCGHGPGFITTLQVTRYAEAVHAAARFAMQSEAHERFAHAADTFGDVVSDFQMNIYQVEDAVVENARQSLTEIARMALADESESGARELSDDLWIRLALDRYVAANSRLPLPD